MLAVFDPILYRSVVLLPLTTFWMVVVIAVLPSVAEATFALGTLPSSSYVTCTCQLGSAGFT